jgi:hypothetical protein
MIFERTIEPFDDSVPVTPQNTQTENGLDTSEIDQYRQGIELVTDTHFYLGIYKIRGLEKNHELKQTTFGDSSIELSNASYFTDTHQFIVKNGIDGFNDLEKINYHNFDGVIEPLFIRKKTPLYLTDYEDTIHDTKGVIGESNSFYNDTCNMIVLVEKTKENNVYPPFTDTTNMSMLLTNSVQANTVVNPYDDSRMKNKISIPSMYEITSSLFLMNPVDYGNNNNEGEKNYSYGFTNDIYTNRDSIAYMGLYYGESDFII